MMLVWRHRRCYLTYSLSMWQANFAVNKPGISIQWQFSFAAYSDFTADLPSLQPLATQDGSAAAAGTPQNTTFNGDVLFGGRDFGPGTCAWSTKYLLDT